LIRERGGLSWLSSLTSWVLFVLIPPPTEEFVGKAVGSVLDVFVTLQA